MLIRLATVERLQVFGRNAGSNLRCQRAMPLSIRSFVERMQFWSKLLLSKSSVNKKEALGGFYFQVNHYTISYLKSIAWWLVELIKTSYRLVFMVFREFEGHTVIDEIVYERPD